MVEIEDYPVFALEVGVPGEDPAAVLLRLDGVLRQPTPDGGIGYRGHEAACDRLAANNGNLEAREGHAQCGRQFTRRGL
jgi:hypothetical protein